MALTEAKKTHKCKRGHIKVINTTHSETIKSFVLIVDINLNVKLLFINYWSG